MGIHPVDGALVVSAGSLFAIIIFVFEIWEERERERDDLLFSTQKRASFTLLGVYIYNDGFITKLTFTKLLETLDMPKIEFIIIWGHWSVENVVAEFVD